MRVQLRRVDLSFASAEGARGQLGRARSWILRRRQVGRVQWHSRGLSAEVFSEASVWRRMAARHGCVDLTSEAAIPMLATGCRLRCFLDEGFEGDFSIRGLDRSAAFVRDLMQCVLSRGTPVRPATPVVLERGRMDPSTMSSQISLECMDLEDPLIQIDRIIAREVECCPGSCVGKAQDAHIEATCTGATARTAMHFVWV